MVSNHKGTSGHFPPQTAALFIVPVIVDPSLSRLTPYFASLQRALPAVPLDFSPIRKAYTGRAYHNLAHLEEMLLHLDRHAPSNCNDAPVFGVALLYHDLVYKPTRKDNESRSADAAVRLLTDRAGIPAARARRCHQLIMCTRDHLPSPEDDGDEALLIDLDLAVLARAPADYDLYVAGVRREFWMLPGFVFRKGRTRALTGLLDRPHLYHTDFGRAHYEAAARENLWRELRHL